MAGINDLVGQYNGTKCIKVQNKLMQLLKAHRILPTTSQKFIIFVVYSTIYILDHFLYGTHMQHMSLNTNANNINEWGHQKYIELKFYISTKHIMQSIQYLESLSCSYC